MKKFYVTLTVATVLMGVSATVGLAYAADGKLGVDPAPCEFKSGSGLLDLRTNKVFYAPETGEHKCGPGLLADYMIAMINFFFRLAITLAVLMIAIGGFQWLMAIGNSSKIANAKDTIQQAVVGLIIAMTATLLFSQIDTSFTEFKKSQFDITVDDILQTQGCLQYTVQKYQYDNPKASVDEAKVAMSKACTTAGCKWDGYACMPGRYLCSEAVVQDFYVKLSAQDGCFITNQERYCRDLQGGVDVTWQCCVGEDGSTFWTAGHGSCVCLPPTGESSYWSKTGNSTCEESTNEYSI